MTNPSTRGWHHKPGDPEGTNRWWDGKQWSDDFSGVAPARGSARSHRPVPSNAVTTLPSLPGFVVEQILGVVTELSATSGLTATSKGTAALTEGMSDLCASAGRIGANAILGLTASAFGAGGGITSAFGGDAVGVLLIGTAARVVPEQSNVTEQVQA